MGAVLTAATITGTYSLGGNGYGTFNFDGVLEMSPR